MLGELNEHDMEALLRAEAVGRLGCYGDGEVYVVPVTYVYEGGSVYGHTHEGMKVRFMRKHPHVCFEVDRTRDLANWESVIAWGIFEPLQGEAAAQAMSLLASRLIPRMVGAPTLPTHAVNVLTRRRTDAHGHKGLVYRIVLDTMTGRFERNAMERTG